MFSLSLLQQHTRNRKEKKVKEKHLFQKDTAQIYNIMNNDTITI